MKLKKIVPTVVEDGVLWLDSFVLISVSARLVWTHDVGSARWTQILYGSNSEMM